MRDVFIDKIYHRMRDDERIFFLSADFGAPSLDALRKEFRDRFINVGIAEQNLINVATGLALEHCIVFAYGIAPFLSMRAYEQIRINLSMLSQLKPLNITLMSVGAGLSYDVSGPTHHCLEDLSVIRTLPNISVFSPSDWVQVGQFFDHSLSLPVPKYARLDGKPLPALYAANTEVSFSDGFCELIKGERVCFVSTGYMTHKARRIVERLRAEDNIHAGLIDVFMLRPYNENSLKHTLEKYGYVITLQEAFVNKGGLDAMIDSVRNVNGLKIEMRHFGFKDSFVFESGDREYLHSLYQLDDQSIVNATKEILKE